MIDGVDVSEIGCRWVGVRGSCFLPIKGRMCPVAPRGFASLGDGRSQVRQRVLRGYRGR